MSQGTRTDIIARVHGNSGYRRGCRCDACRIGHRDAERVRLRNLRAVPEPVRKVRTKPNAPPHNSVPVDRFWPILEQWMKENREPRFAGDESGGMSALARTVGCDFGAIARIRDRTWVTFKKADRILCAIGRVDVWHTDLADIYENDSREEAA